MIVLDNDYFVNKRGLDLQARLKTQDNASRAVQNFLEQLSFRIYDYVLSHSTKFRGYDDLDQHIETLSPLEKEQFKRAIAEQVIYILSVGDTNYIFPDGTVNYSLWKEMRICPQAKDILFNLRLISKAAPIGEEDYVYDIYSFDTEFRY